MSKYDTAIITDAGLQALKEQAQKKGTFLINKVIASDSSAYVGNSLEELHKLTNLTEGRIYEGRIESNPKDQDNTYSFDVKFDNTKNPNQDFKLVVIGLFGKTADSNEEKLLLLIKASTLNDAEVLPARVDDDLTYTYTAHIMLNLSRTDKVSIKYDYNGYINWTDFKKHEEQADLKIQEIKDIAENYGNANLKEKDWNQVLNHNKNYIKVKQNLYDTDKTLSVYGKPADAKTTGDKINAIDKEIISLNQEVHKSYTTKNETQEVKNALLANDDLDKEQNRKIDSLNEINQQTQESLNNLSQGYTKNILKEKSHENILNHNQNLLTAKNSIIDTDKSLAIYGKPADAEATGSAIKALNQVLEHLNQNIYNNFTSKAEAQLLHNMILANTDSNQDQDKKISDLNYAVSEIKANNQDFRILTHDNKSLTNSFNDRILGKKQIFAIDNSLQKENAFANSKAIGDAINLAYTTLNQSINTVLNRLNSIEQADFIINIVNRLAVAEDTNKKLQNELNQLQNRPWSYDSADAESSRNDLNSITESGRYYLGYTSVDSYGYEDAILEVSKLGNTQKISQWLYSASNNNNRSQRRVGERNGDTYTWGQWALEY